MPVSTYSAEPAPSAALLGETGASVSGEPEPPAAAPQSEEMEAAPRSQEMERAYEGTARGSIESLGRWKEKRDDRAMPPEMGRDVRRAFGKFVDELVQNGASSGILAITGRDISWSASPDDTSYQRHGVYESSLKAALAKEEWWASLDLKTLTTQLSTAMQNEHYDEVRRNGPSKRSMHGTSRANGGAAVAFRLGRHVCCFQRFILFTALRGGRTALRRRRSTRTSTRSRDSVVVVWVFRNLFPERARGDT